MPCFACNKPAMRSHIYRVNLRICSACSGTYKEQFNLPYACELAAKMTDNPGLRAALLEAAIILRKAIK